MFQKLKTVVVFLKIIVSFVLTRPIGKYIRPMCYQRIIETVSLNQLSSEEQRILLEYPKQSSSVTNIHCQKQRLCEVSCARAL